MIQKQKERQQDFNRYIKELKHEISQDARDLYICGIKNILELDDSTNEDGRELLLNSSLSDTKIAEICTVPFQDIVRLKKYKDHTVINPKNKLKKIYVGLTFGVG